DLWASSSNTTIKKQCKSLRHSFTKTRYLYSNLYLNHPSTQLIPVMKINTFPTFAFLLFLSHTLYAQRDTISFNDNWQFAIYPDGTKVDTGQPLPDARIVTLPHTWNVEDKYQNHYGWGWYQKTFN